MTTPHLPARAARALAALALAAAWMAPGAFQPLQAQQAGPELPAMALLADGRRLRGYVQNSNEQGLLFSLVEGAPGTGYNWGSQVTAVAFDEADVIMQEARAAFVQGRFEAAAERFGRIADIYAHVSWVPNSFAAEARYGQIESLRRLARWSEIAPLLETPAARAIPTRLSEFYQPQHKLNQLWAGLGAGQLDGVRAEVEMRELPVAGQDKLLPTPSFREMPLRELVQVSFMRAKVHEADGKPELALSDYYRVFSLTFGNDAVISALSMREALAIQAKDPSLANEASVMPRRQIQSLAFLYKNAFGKGEIDPAYAAFAVRPDLPKPTPAPQATEEGEAPKEEAKEGEEKADAKAPEEKAGEEAEEKEEAAGQ